MAKLSKAVGFLVWTFMMTISGCIEAWPTSPMAVASDTGQSVEELRGSPEHAPIHVHGGRIQAFRLGDHEYSVDLTSFGDFAVRQENDDWCWAACVEMITAYHGHRITQTEVVEKMHGDAKHDGNDAGSVRDVLLSLDSRQFFTTVSTCPVTWCIHDLLFGSPVLLILKPPMPNGVGHAVVLTGIDYFYRIPSAYSFNGDEPVVNRLTIYDPTDGRSHEFVGPVDVREFHSRIGFAAHLSRWRYEPDIIDDAMRQGPAGYQERYVRALDRLDSVTIGRPWHYNEMRLRMLEIEGRTPA